MFRTLEKLGNRPQWAASRRAIPIDLEEDEVALDPAAIRDMAERYAKAWCSHSPEAVASFYEETGRIVINNGEAIVGRAAIADMTKGFFSEFPDLVVHLDDIRTAGHNAIFVWTLEGTHSETGNSVKVGGWEEWTLSDNLLVSASLGRFDAVEYARQVAEGI
jgi:uncharacterized protein (TIGR02246 family)